MNPATVHLVDDDESHLRAVARLLSTTGFQVRTFSSGKSMLEFVDRETRGCVVADLEMPELDGLELLAELRRAGIFMPVLFLTGRGDIPRTVRAMQGGADDFIEKHVPAEHLIAAIRKALAHDASESERVRQLGEIARRFEGLTKRELEVLAELVKGLLNKQIAAKLGISERTVKMHRTSITTKVGVHSAAQLATLARDAGLFETPAKNAIR